MIYCFNSEHKFLSKHVTYDNTLFNMLKFGEYPLHDLNRTEFEAKISEWGTIEDSFVINNNECWLVKKYPKKRGKK